MSGTVGNDKPGLTWRALKWLGLSLAALVGMAQIGATVQEAVPTGAISVTALYAPGQIASGWAGTSVPLDAWADASRQYGLLGVWLYLHLGFDVLFIAGYAMLGRTLLPKKSESERITRLMLWALVAADCLEDLAAVPAFIRIIGHHHAVFPVTVVLHIATILKWVAALVFLVRLAFVAWDSARGAIGHAFSALWEQRFSVVVVVFLAVLAAGRGPDVLEQMPDVQRSWLTWPAGMGWVHAAVAVIAQLLLAVLLLALGRMRTLRANEKFSGVDTRGHPDYLPWLLFPAALAVLALVLWVTDGAEIQSVRLGVALGVPLAVGISSWIIALFYRHRRAEQARRASGTGGSPEPAGEAREPEPAGEAREPEDPGGRRERPDLVSPKRLPIREVGLPSLFRRGPEARQVTVVTDHMTPDDDGMQVLGRPLPEMPLDKQAKRVAAVKTAGDALAVAVVAVTGLGLVRSFTALGLLYDGGYTVAAWVAVVLGIVVVTFIWPLADGPVRDSLGWLAKQRGQMARFAGWARRGRMGEKSGSESEWWPWAVTGAPFLIADACLLFVPLWATHWLGVLGTTVIATGTLAVVLAVLVNLAQTRRPLPLFRLVRLNVTPVITLIAVIGLVGASVGSSPVLHEIRGPVSATDPSAKPNPPDQLDSWLGTPPGTSADACAVPAPAASTAATEGTVQVRPLILVAAAGGGIRAAWWAERALAGLAAIPCGRADVFAVSSVSGGSVGMAVLDSTRTTRAADADLADIAGPDALAVGIDGLLLHDMIAGFTGLDLPAAQMPPGQPFADRAGLIESAWQREDSGLAQPFPLQTPPLPWRLLFNSTDADSGCRAIIADQPLWSAAGSLAGNGITCDLRSAVPSGGSFNFFAELPCMRNIAMVTAAMLSARFPFITPSGVVTSCVSKGALAGQFVDGGYADSSGLLTLADLMPSLIAQVRAHNADALADGGPGKTVTLVAPIVMYLGNSPRPVPVDPAASLIQEPYVPLDAKSAAGAQLAVSDTLLQRIQGMLGIGQWLQCGRVQDACDAAQSAVARAVHYQLIFVSPRTEPRISAPLGWVLSTASRTFLDRELANEAKESSQCWQHPEQIFCQPGVGRLADLLQLIRGG
jgi:hypothetical protein